MANVSVPVVYEDNACIVFNKPAGLLTIPTDKNEERTLVNCVNQQHSGQGHLYPAHRLDRDTSGVIIFAKGKDNQERLMQAFKAKKVKKVYTAFVHGKLMPREGSIRIPIKDYHQRKFQPSMPAQSALTQYQVIDYGKDFTQVKVMPITGRTNQIRIHFAKIKHPLVGEDKYAFRKDFALRFRRTALHAQSIEFPHPQTGKMIRANADLPNDMENFLATH